MYDRIPLAGNAVILPRFKLGDRLPTRTKVLAGLFAGMVSQLTKGKLLGIIPSMVFAAGVELLHGGLALAIVRPFSEAIAIVLADIPEMIVR